MITSYDELPPHFKELYKSLPPRLDIPRACEVSQSSRAILYEKFGSGRVIAVKDGGKTLADTLSLLLDLVNLPPAHIAPPKRKSAAMADSAATEPRRKRPPVPAPKAATAPPPQRGRPRVQSAGEADGAQKVRVEAATK
jgi:hypothetical protein